MNTSIVIPTLNEADNLPECLQNLLPQTADWDEVIVVDGGSDDGTDEIALDAGCKLIEAPDTSIGTARNIGTTESTNPIVASIDADSLPPVGWLDKIKTHFNNDPDLSVLWGSIVDSNGVPMRNMVGKFSTILGGASGNNTAFRRAHFDELEFQYPDISFLEDVAIIYRLAQNGKAKRDKSLVMMMDMDRKRYQTIPVLGMGAATALASRRLDGKWANIAKGASAGMVGTEMTYENATGTPLHHDQIGAALTALSKKMDDDLADELLGAGVGMILHHDMTEGISALPTQLQQHTE